VTTCVLCVAHAPAHTPHNTVAARLPSRRTPTPLPRLCSGGNGHALAHFQASNGLYPLCVKLGTITAAGGDVYSYAPDEDDMVTDPHLGRHLAHWGINVMELAKTEKSMAELNIDLNASYDFSRICEAGRDLVAVSGPGLIGCENLGNSCYMASVLQALAALPATAALYVGGPDAGVARALFASTPTDGVPADDLLTQTAKVMAGLTTGAYAGALPPPAAAGGGTAPAAAAGADEAATAANAVALAMTGASSADAAALTHTTADDAAATAGEDVPLPPAPGTACGFIVPRSFKTLIGRGHAEFASGRQQDAIEFFEYLLGQLDRAHHRYARRMADALAAGGGAAGGAGITSLSQLFTFAFETRLRDLSSPGAAEQQHVRYGSVQERFWRLPIPLEAAVPLEAAPGADGGDDAASAAKRARGEGGAAISSSSAGAAAPAAPGGAPTQRVPFAACVQSWAGASELSDVVSFVTGARGAAAQTTRFASFPPVLVLQLGRYYTKLDWTTGKVDASVPMPLTMTLDRDAADAGGSAGSGGGGGNFLPSFSVDLKAKGPQPGETVHAGDKAPGAAAAAAPAPAAAAASAAAPPPQPDPLVVAELESMGFPHGACARAAVATAGRGSEAAAEYVMAHMDDPDFIEPYVPAAAAVAAPATAAAAATAPAAAVDAGSLAMLCDMGFDGERATYALRTTGGNLERAADWLFAHADEPLPAAAAPAAATGGAGPMEVDAAAAAGEAAPAVLGSGARGVYDLTGVISHMGRSTASGHYVAHIRKQQPGGGGSSGVWYLFNDAKVAVSQDPPLDLGYIYVYTRRDGGGGGSA
jgi:ubiquitin carboxyl-terminal hydrolase 5/13